MFEFIESATQIATLTVGFLLAMVAVFFPSVAKSRLFGFLLGEAAFLIAALYAAWIALGTDLFAPFGAVIWFAIGTAFFARAVWRAK